jgi:hypothetical protein
MALGIKVLKFFPAGDADDQLQANVPPMASCPISKTGEN